MLEVNTIYNEDCLETMKRMPDNFVDLTITSPPYNLGDLPVGEQRRKKVGKKLYDKTSDNLTDDKYTDWLANIIEESLRVSRYVFVNIQFLNGTRSIISKIHTSFYKNLKDIFIWNKQAQCSIHGNKGMMSKGWEFIFMFGNNNSAIFNYHNFPKNSYVPNRQNWNRKGEKFNHNATFPIELPSYFIENFSKKNDLIYDPFMGSGTTARACMNLHRNYIGSEISSEYCEIIKKRLAQQTLL